MNPQNSCFASGNPYTNRKSKSKRKNPSILALFVFIDELMLRHHEPDRHDFSSAPRLLHDLNCNEYHARKGNSCSLLQFMIRSVNSCNTVAIHCVFSVKDNKQNQKYRPSSAPVRSRIIEKMPKTRPKMPKIIPKSAIRSKNPSTREEITARISDAAARIIPTT